MKKGYTLIELLGVIILLSLLTLIVIPNIVNSIKRTNSKNEDLMKNIIVSAAKLYMNDTFPDTIAENGFAYCVPISKLVELKYIEQPVKYNNIDDISGISSVKITYTNTFYYNVVDNSVCNFENTLTLQDQTSSSKAYFFNTNIIKEDIESVYVLNNMNIPNTAIKVFDISESHDNSVKLWYTDSNENNLYEVYIGSEGSVNANINSRRLFSNLINATTIDLEYLDTTNVEDASYMFENCTNLVNLNISHLVTSNVSTMSHMFDNCSSLVNINISGFTTEGLKNINSMFHNTAELTEINMINANYNSIENSKDVFKGTKNGITVRTNSTASTRITNYLTTSGVTNPTVVTN